MFVQVARYRLGTGTVDELRERVERGPAVAMREVAGFVSYHAFDAGDGEVASVAIFASEAGVREAERRLDAWVEDTMAAFAITPVDLAEGAVFASASARD